MKDMRSILIPALTTALTTATGRKVYDSMPIQLFGTAIYPCINIADVFVEEDGPKNSYQYRATILIEVVHKGLQSLTSLYTDMDNVLSMVNNGVPFALVSPYNIMDCTLNTTTTTKATTEKGLIDIGIIRLIFRIQ